MTGKYKRTEEIKKKISDSLKGRHLSEETKFKLSIAHLGKKKQPFTEEHLKNMSLVKRGIPLSEEHKKNISLALKGKRNNPAGEFKRGHLGFNHHKPMSDDVRNIHRKNQLSRYEKYGCINTEETRKKLREKRALQIFPIKDTSIEIKVQNFLKELKIEFFTHQYMREIEHGYQCDILIPSKKMVIECDGNYWHKYPIGNEIDHVRTNELIEKGFKVLRLWENEINNMNLNKFKKRLICK